MGAVWLLAAASKLIETLPAYEFTSKLVGGGDTAKAALAAQVFLEVLLGTAMLVGVVRGLLLSLGGMAAVSVALLVVRSQVGGTLPCGCFAAFADGTVDEALVRNALISALLMALIALDIRGRSADTDSVGEPEEGEDA
jgi:hypothetical protein